MIKNYFKIAWRNFIKNKTLSIINITGLSVSIAFCLILLFYIRYEQSYDTFHAKKDHLYRLEMTAYFLPGIRPKKVSSLSLRKMMTYQTSLYFLLLLPPICKMNFLKSKALPAFKTTTICWLK